MKKDIEKTDTIFKLGQKVHDSTERFPLGYIDLVTEKSSSGYSGYNLQVWFPAFLNNHIDGEHYKHYQFDGTKLGEKVRSLYLGHDTNDKNQGAKNMRYINLTPHTISITNGATYQSEGTCRVSSTHNQVGSDPLTYIVEYGAIEGLPEPEEGKIYIISLIALNVAKSNGRTDCVAPASGHPDVIRNKGQIVSAPGFVK